MQALHAGDPRQRLHPQGHLRGPLLRACEAYYTEADLVDGNCPIHGRPVEWLEEDNWFFELSTFAQPLLDWYEAHPDFVQPEGKRNEALGIIRQGLEDVSITRTSITWGVPVPWDEGHVFYVWYDALINYATAVGYGTDPDRFDDVVAGRAPPHRQGHPALPLRLLAGHAAWPPASSRPAQVAVHGFLLVGGEKMSQDQPQPDLPGRPRGRLRRRRVPLPLPARQPLRPRRRLLLRGHGRPATTPTWPTTSATCCPGWPRSWARSAAGVGPAPAPDRPLAAVAAEAYAETAAGWDGIAPSLALEATWRLIREANAHLEANEPWKMEPGPEVDAVMGDALEVLRLVAILATPAMPSICEQVWARIGLPGAPGDQRLPEAAAWGGYPGGLPVEKGDPLFPRMTVPKAD